MDNVILSLVLGYSNTDFTRLMKIENVPASALSSVANATIALNASLAAGTDDGLADFFRADDFDDSDPNNVVGKLSAIKSIYSNVITTEPIDLNG